MASGFKWTRNRDIAAVSLADGDTQIEAAEKAGVTTRTIRNWLSKDEFSIEVDRLTLMMGVSTRAKRLQIVKRVIRGRVENTEYPMSKADLLDWLKFAQSETDGIKLDLAAFFAAAASVAGSGSNRPAELESGISRNGRTKTP